MAGVQSRNDTGRSQPGLTTQHPVNSHPAISMQRVLLVDDQAHVLRVMKLCLDRNGFYVDTALGGDIALQMMHDDRYDVVIADYQLARMNGQQLCDSVASRFGDAPPLIVMLCNELDAEAQGSTTPTPTTQNCPRLVIEHVVKPVSLSWLVARLTCLSDHFQNSLHG